MKPFISRLIWILLLFVGAMIFPWYIILGIAFISGFFIKNFFEIVALGVFYDVLFYSQNFQWYQVIVHTGISILLFVITILITKITRKPNIFI